MAFTTFQDKSYENMDPNSKEPSGHDGTVSLTTQLQDDTSVWK